jgi:NADH-quinone oxidoreductase subunit L
MIGRFFSVYVNKLIVYLLTITSSAFGAILTSIALLYLPADNIINTETPFFKIGDFVVNYGLHIDKTALIFAFLLFSISFLIQLFSISYMENEKKTYKFYALLNLFNFAMASLFFSPNLFQTYFFWELSGVISYLLIGFEYFKKQKSNASKKVFIINRIGDTALIGAILLSSYFIYAYAPSKSLATLSFMDMNIISTLIYAYTTEPVFKIITILFIIGAIIKSAQFPFYTWLQDAMQAKLPVSALLHSSTLVAVGVFLILRLLPFYSLESWLLKLITELGLLTTILCSISACAEQEPKKVLAYSTSAQLGLVFFAIGQFEIKAGLVLFIAHAFIKSMLFIVLPRENEKWNLTNVIIFILGALSLSGILFSGLIAKEIITLQNNTFSTIIVSIISFLTAFYILKILLLNTNKMGIEKKRPNILELIASSGLLILNILFFIYLQKTISYKINGPFWTAIIALLITYFLYRKNAFYKIPILYQLAKNGFYLDKFYTHIFAKIYDIIASISNLFEIKILNNYFLPVNVARTTVNFFNFIEEKFMNGFIKFIIKIFNKISLLNLKAQTGNIQRYNAYAFIIITIILTCLMLGYTAILIYIGG